VGLRQCRRAETAVLVSVIVAVRTGMDGGAADGWV
jgi:hypothetical protein